MSDIEYSDEMFNSLWTKKYAPVSIAEMVLSDENRKIINEYINDCEFPSLLLCGRPGQGKTTLATLLCQEIDASVLMINASFDNGIDIIRGQINTFCRTMSIDGSLKVVILDEADRLSPQSQDALRGMIEDYAGDTRFILTANESGRVSKALQSRCIALNITPPKDRFIDYLVNILKSENIQVNENQFEKLKQLIDRHYPDLRKTIGALQKYSIRGVLDIQSSECEWDYIANLFTQIKEKDEIAIREAWIKHESEFQGDYPQLLKACLEFIFAHETTGLGQLTYSQRGSIILSLADGLRDSTFVADQEINFYATILRIKAQI